jgi:hypothetical protein
MEMIPDATDDDVHALRLARDAEKYKDIVTLFARALLDG